MRNSSTRKTTKAPASGDCGRKTQPAAADEADAVTYYNDSYDYAPVDADKLVLKAIDCVDPTDHYHDASHIIPNRPDRKPGWLLKVPKAAWAETLAEEFDHRDFSHIVDQYARGTLRPGIAIEGEFGDGKGRATFFYAIGRRMPVARFTRRR